MTIISLYLNPLPGANAPPIEHSIFQVMKEASLLYCLPDNPFFYAGKGPSGDHAVQEATYACEYRASQGIRSSLIVDRTRRHDRLRVDLRAALL